MARLTTRLQVMIPPELDADLETIARLAGVTKAVVARHLLGAARSLMTDPGDLVEYAREIEAAQDFEATGDRVPDDHPEQR